MTELPSAGQLFAGRYRVLGRLGRGGHGAVYRATDGFLDTDVALKILLPEQLDEVGRDRFRREALLGERLTNPHSVRLLAHGEDEQGVPYIAFELLEGRPLSQWLAERGPQSSESAGRIASAVLEALVEAHDLGMVHRDIKPANIHLCEHRGQPDFVKVLDFGIAKRAARDATQLTAEDVVIGTARYMAPEQLRGEAISAATDLYSLGLVMAELLAGEPVFRGPAIDVCLEQVSSRPVPLDDRVRGSLLGPQIERATRKDPSARYPSARAMLDALSGDRPVTLADDGPTKLLTTAAIGPERGATRLYGEPLSTPLRSVVPVATGPKTWVFGEVPASAAPVPASTPVQAAVPASSTPVAAAVPASNPVLGAVTPSNPVYNAVPVSAVPHSAAPVSPRQSLVPATPRPAASSGLWAIGLITVLLLLLLLSVSGVLLFRSTQQPEAPPPLPSAR